MAKVESINTYQNEIKKRAPHSEKCAKLDISRSKVAQTLNVNGVRRAKRDSTMSAHHNAQLLNLSYKSSFFEKKRV